MSPLRQRGGSVPDVTLPSGPLVRQPIDDHSPWWTVHVARYHHVVDFVRGKRVLDIACGSGLGLSILGQHSEVVGMDVDHGTAVGARQHAKERVLVGDGRNLPFRDQSFDAVVSFETIEHFDRRDRFVSELARVLTDDGTLILSTPNANHTRPTGGKPRNPFHVHEYAPEELSRELETHFGSVRLMGQVLDPRFRVPPLWDEQEALAAEGRRLRVLTWRALAKLPRGIGDVGSRWLWRQPLLPDVEDYRFLDSEVERAPVLVAFCSR